ncbi:MAG: L-threonylcarbamoyladenylate synthase [Lentimonas sp.]|jgi:L-threonylcarbamoyladenylate synthase
MESKRKEAVEILKSGGTVLYPSDTIWGLGCDATDEEACQKILDIKNRPDDKSLILLMDSFRMVEHYVPNFAEIVYELVDLSDKPLTIIYPTSRNLAPSVLAADGSVGIRITKDPLCLELIRGLKRPIVSTSANLSGQNHPGQFSEINEKIKSGVDIILEEKTSDSLINPSQIIKIELNGAVKILRK